VAKRQRQGKTRAYGGVIKMYVGGRGDPSGGKWQDILGALAILGMLIYMILVFFGVLKIVK
jgi:hypothetical protein